MTHLIQSAREPDRLILAWQAPDEKKNRTRFAVGELLRQGDEATLRYFQDASDVDEATKLGYQGYPAFKASVPLHSQGVMAAFMRRLPPRGRHDFTVYFTKLGFSPFATVSAFGLLAASEARLPSDGFSLVDPLDGISAPTEMRFEIAGYRHCDPDLKDHDIGSLVSFVPEPTNPYDPNALMVQKGNKKLGYINRLQAVAFQQLLSDFKVSAWVDRLNGTPDHPRAFLFVQVR